MLIIGVTGSIASGKSTVDAMLLDLGATVVIDADRTVHDLLRDDAEVRGDVLDAFGPGIIGVDGAIDRKALGAIVFADPAALRGLEAIIHPAVRRVIRAMLAAQPGDAIAVVDAVKLLDGDLAGLVDSVWWVTAHPEQQLDRLLRIRGMSEEAARARLAAQPRIDRYYKRINVIIDNSGSLTDTRSHVEVAFHKVLAAHSLVDGAGR